MTESPGTASEAVELLPKFYSAAEEQLNVVSHAVGLVLSVIGLALLVLKAATLGNSLHIVSFAIFGASLVALYAASTVYHSTKDPTRRTQLRTVDHATIYILIAGTYTPFTLVALSGTVGWTLFGVAWGMAVTGIILKLFYTGRFNILSTSMYVLMGWIIVFAIKPLMAALPEEGVFWLFAGGIAYTVGAVSYSIKKIPYGHAVFHFFVLAGSACHFVAVYWYILPSS